MAECGVFIAVAGMVCVTLSARISRSVGTDRCPQAYKCDSSALNESHAPKTVYSTTDGLAIGSWDEDGAARRVPRRLAEERGARVPDGESPPRLAALDGKNQMVVSRWSTETCMCMQVIHAQARTEEWSEVHVCPDPSVLLTTRAQNTQWR